LDCNENVIIAKSAMTLCSNLVEKKQRSAGLFTTYILHKHPSLRYTSSRWSNRMWRLV